MENIKSINQNKCPHCGGEILIEFETPITTVIGVITRQHIEDAKKLLLDKVKNLDITDEEKKDVENWVNDPEVVFGPDDVESLISDIQKKK